ncbi:hypothetical protein [Chitinophaga sp.]|nr:hypothetical protein [Chitinophaga sp.]
MRAFKYFIVSVVLIAGLSSCLVVRDRTGYYRPYHHHHYYHGYYR